MTSLKQKLLASGAAAVVAVGGGLAIANIGSGDTASATQGGPPSGQQMGGSQQGGGPGQQDLSALAKDLGVTEAKLQEAMQSAMPHVLDSVTPAVEARSAAWIRLSAASTRISWRI